MLKYDLHIVDDAERKEMFEKDIAGGFCNHKGGKTVVKLFISSDFEGEVEECTIEILNHEILHLALRKVEREKTERALDKIHKPFYVFDCETRKWQFVIKFIHEKNGKTLTII